MKAAYITLVVSTIAFIVATTVLYQIATWTRDGRWCDTAGAVAGSGMFLLIAGAASIFVYHEMFPRKGAA